jgi:hypothetical protein
MTIDGVLDWLLDLLTTLARNVITLNYTTIADFHTLQVTVMHTKFFPAHSVFTSSCLVTASNNGYSSASGIKSSPNGYSLPTELCYNCVFYNSSARAK